MRQEVINLDALLDDTTEGILQFDPSMPKDRAAELAKLNLDLVEDLMLEAQATSIQTIVVKERYRKKYKHD